MADTHSKKERVMLFRMGWKAGAAMRKPSEKAGSDRDYLKGYNQGRNAYSTAMRVWSKYLGVTKEERQEWILREDDDD